MPPPRRPTPPRPRGTGAYLADVAREIVNLVFLAKAGVASRAIRADLKVLEAEQTRLAYPPPPRSCAECRRRTELYAELTMGPERLLALAGATPRETQLRW